MSLLPLIPDLHDTPKPLHNTRWEMHPDWAHLPLHRQRPWLNAGDHIPKKSHIGPDGFQVILYVKHFAPHEITVKTVDDTIVVEAKHEDRPDEHGHVSRHFRRTYHLPEGFDVKDVVSTISSDDILTVKVPPETSASKRQNVRHVQIHQTGPARLNVDDRVENPES